MQDINRRSDEYLFTSMDVLLKFFYRFFPKQVLESELKAAAKGFVRRRGCTDQETHLQFIKKCEYRFIRRVRNRMGERQEPNGAKTVLRMQNRPKWEFRPQMRLKRGVSDRAGDSANDTLLI